MLAECDFAFREERSGDVALGLSKCLTIAIGFRFWEAETESDDENRWASSEPEEGTPAVGGRVDETAGERCG